MWIWKGLTILQINYFWQFVKFKCFQILFKKSNNGPLWHIPWFLQCILCLYYCVVFLTNNNFCLLTQVENKRGKAKRKKSHLLSMRAISQKLMLCFAQFEKENKARRLCVGFFCSIFIHLQTVNKAHFINWLIKVVVFLIKSLKKSNEKNIKGNKKNELMSKN